MEEEFGMIFYITSLEFIKYYINKDQSIRSVRNTKMQLSKLITDVLGRRMHNDDLGYLSSSIAENLLILKLGLTLDSF